MCFFTKFGKEGSISFLQPVAQLPRPATFPPKLNINLFTAGREQSRDQQGLPTCDGAPGLWEGHQKKRVRETLLCRMWKARKLRTDGVASATQRAALSGSLHKRRLCQGILTISRIEV